MGELKLRPTVPAEELQALLDIVREDFPCSLGRIANMTNAQILKVLAENVYLRDAFTYFDQHGSIECMNSYVRGRRQEADLTRTVGRVIRVHEGDNCKPNLRLLVHNTTRDQAVHGRIRNVTHNEPLVIPACDIPDEELFRAMRKAG